MKSRRKSSSLCGEFERGCPDGAFGDFEEVAGILWCSCVGEEFEPLCGIYIIYDQASEITFQPPVFRSAASISLRGNRGHLLNLSDQLRRKFSIQRPFEGGC